MAGDGAADRLPLLPAKPSPARWNMYAFSCATLASMTSILGGYSIAVMSGAQIFMKEDLGVSDTEIEVLSGIVSLYSLIGALVAGWTSDRFGRRLTIVISNVLFCAGALVMALAGGYPALMAGRFLAGVGVGYAFVIAPIYAAEISPASTRGFLSSLPEIFINSGVLLSYVSNFAFAGLPSHINWRIMFAVGLIPPIFLAAGVLFMPESPRWLVMKSRISDAHRVLLRTSDSADEADDRLRAIKDVSDGDPGQSVWKELLVNPSPPVRRVLLAVLGLQFFQQACGIDTIVLYSPRVLGIAGISSSTALLGITIAVGISKAFFIFVPMFLADRVGRRILLLTSAAGMAVSLIILGTALLASGTITTAMSVAAIVAYVGIFSVGFGPLAWVYSSEILPLRLRAQGASLGTAMNRVVSAVVTMTFISMYEAISLAGSFYLYAGVAAAAWVFVYFRLPETRGRTLEDVEKLFTR